jgi:Ca2+-binding EF-hand superfamily protein
MFSKYVKEMVYAIDANHDGMISDKELSDMMEHIGLEKSWSRSEMQALFEELGRDYQNEKQIPTESVEQLLLSHIQ